VGESVASGSNGTGWNGPYLVSPNVGSIFAPTATLSPAGFVDVSWLQDAPGPWEAAQVILAIDGAIVSGPSALPGAPTGRSSATSPSVAYDGLDRALYVWGAPTNGSAEYTGGFLPASSLVPVFRSGLNATVPAEFQSGVSPGQIANFHQTINASLNVTAVDLAPPLTQGGICGAAQVLLSQVYPAATTYLTGPTTPNASLWSACTPPLKVVPSTSLLAATNSSLEADGYLGVYCEWLAEALGLGVYPSSNWTGTPWGGSVPLLPPVRSGGPNHGYPIGTWGLNTTDANRTGSTLNVTPIGLNPNAVWLDAVGTFPTAPAYTHSQSCSAHYGTGIWVYWWANYTITTKVSAYTTHGSANNANGTGSVAQTSASLPQIFLANLSAAMNGSWSESVDVTYSFWMTGVLNCSTSATYYSNHPWSAPPGWPAQTTLAVKGTFTTGLSPYPYRPSGKVWTLHGKQSDIWNWNNTVEANATTWLNETRPRSIANSSDVNLAPHQGNYSLAEEFAYNAPPVFSNDTIMFKMATMHGGYNTTWTVAPNGQINFNEVGPNTHPFVNYSAPERSTYSCTFTQLPLMVGLYWYHTTNITNVSSTRAQLEWYSNVSGQGWASYYDFLGGGTFSVDATMLKIAHAPTGAPNSGYVYQYTAELRDLHAWGFYTANVGVGYVEPCLTYENYTTWTFQSQTNFALQEYDYPYDSITKQGGGALVEWQVPSKFSAAAKFVGGNVLYWPTNVPANVTAVPFFTLSSVISGPFVEKSVGNLSYGENLTALTGNTNYTAEVFLNYTLLGGTQNFSAVSVPTSFVYERDTSGDGLTDWEKLRGWTVTEQYAPGQFESSTVTADPDRWSTEGITNDFLEKEYGLDPEVLSTTGDGLLDMYNLTFDLGVATTNISQLPSTGFEYWLENTSYQFNHACPDPAAGTSCSFSPPVVDANNLTATGSSNPGADNSPWGAEVLWNGVGNGSALAQLEAMIATGGAGWLGYLRAVTGEYKINGVWHRTITVWGKLSWGADPLAWSTSEFVAPGGQTVPDGALVNPLGIAAVNLTLDSWSMSGLNSQGGDGVGVFVHATSAANSYFPGGQTDYSAYSVTGTAPGAGYTYNVSQSSKDLVFPINFLPAPAEQYAQVNFSLVANNSNHGFITDNTGTLKIDLENSNTHAASYHGHSAGQNYTLNLTYRAEPVYSKANTYVVVPGDNSTLNALPFGLKRYTGEQDFVLFSVDETVAGNGRPLGIGSIPYVNSTAANGISTQTYAAGLAAGMNNILVPRSLFIHSPLGQMLLTNVTNATGKVQNVSIASNGYNGVLQASWNPALWEARILGYSNYQGTNYSQGNPGFITLYSNTNQNCTGGTECGTVPGNPNIDSSVPSYAIGAIYTLSVGTNGTLANLLAGLLLNASGNFTNWLLPATSLLPSLGLSSEVTSALANPVLFSSGGYAAPGWHPPAPQPSVWQQIGAAVWNAVSGVVETIGAALWTAFAAAAAFVAYLVDEIANWGLGVLQQTASVLKMVAGAIVLAIDQLAAALLGSLESLIEAIFSPLWSAIKFAANAIENLVESFANATMGYLGGTRSLGFTSSAAALALGPFSAFAISMEAIVCIVIGVTLPVSLGASFLLGLLVGVVTQEVGPGLLSSRGGGFANQIASIVASSITGTARQIATSAESAMNWSYANVLGSSTTTGEIQPVPDPPDWVGIVGIASLLSTIILTVWAAGKASPDTAAVAGFYIAFISLGLVLIRTAFVSSQQNGCNDLPPGIYDSILAEDVGSTVLSLPAVAMSFIGTRSLDAPLKTLGIFGLGFGIVSLVAGAVEVNTDLTCAGTVQ
jgi:hypothetical protein